MDIEAAGRTCYKSEDRITQDSAVAFVKMIIKSGHHSVLEHVSRTVRVICDRGVSHEIVRHRIAAYSQESTRYCNYCKEKFGSEITFIDPYPFIPKPSEAYDAWMKAMQQAEEHYFEIIRAGLGPQMARSVLPNSLKTEIVITYNVREWRHFFTLRTNKRAHPQMRQIACPLLRDFRIFFPVLFDDVGDIDE